MQEKERPEDVQIFDRRAVQHHQDRAFKKLNKHDFLLQEVGSRLVDRLYDIDRTFNLAVELGARGSILCDQLSARDKVSRLVQFYLSNSSSQTANNCLVGDEEFLPFAPGSVDLFYSNLALHWTNDLPGALTQIRHSLRPNGFFVASMFGGNTLIELREALTYAEISEVGGISPRISPFAELADAAALLQRAGFALPVADSDTITVTYGDAFALMHDLRGMGETNALTARHNGFTRRSILFDAAARYAKCHTNSEGRIPATFQIIYLTGWAPHKSQQKPLAPGTSTARLAEALDAVELSAGENADPIKE